MTMQCLMLSALVPPGVEPGKIWQWVFCCLRCCLACFEKCMKWLNKNVYVETILRNSWFCASACHVAGAMLNYMDYIAITKPIAGGLIWFGKGSVAFGATRWSIHPVSSLLCLDARHDCGGRVLVLDPRQRQQHRFPLDRDHGRQLHRPIIVMLAHAVTACMKFPRSTLMFSHLFSFLYRMCSGLKPLLRMLHSSYGSVGNFFGDL